MPQRSSGSVSIGVVGVRLIELLRRDPGLKRRLDEAMAEGWLEAGDLAIAETNLPDDPLPEHCPYRYPP